ncbi:serine/threonine-protein kinase [Frankia tisae]|uniref:serine/threonine-protein kinase n=1 Tax=Frankia tisae TaxID=2950104 RepID=UPI0021BEDDE6|nr:serine/threonine-protein kinase [Frankia tisae]
MTLDFSRIEAALPDYEIQGIIGHGGFGLVLAGQHRYLDERQVAIKMLVGESDNAEGQSRFRAEARLLERLAHPHIVRIYDYTEQNDLRLLVMERLGDTLRARARAGMTVDLVVAVGLAAAAALERAHTESVFHRDIKPDNMLFAGNGQLKVTDFGIAKILEMSAATAATMIGTPRYMAPEQITQTGLGPGSDLYALGVVLFELLTGTTPFPREPGSVEMAEQRSHAEPPPLPSAPPGIAAAVRHVLAADIRERPPSARAFAVELARAAADAWGPGWLDRCPMPVHLSQEVRDAAHTGTPAVARGAQGSGAPAEGWADEPTTIHVPWMTPDRFDQAVSAPPSPSPSPAPGESPAATPGGAMPPPPDGRTPQPGRITPRRALFGRGRTRRAAAEPGRPLTVAHPFDLALAADGSLFVSQPLHHQVSRIPRPGAVAVHAGNGRAGFAGDGGPAASAELNSPYGIAVDPRGTLYIADHFNNRVRRIGPDGVVTTWAGSGLAGPPLAPGVRVAAARLALNRPRSLAVDGGGVLYVASTDNHQIIRVDPDGVAELVAGCGESGFSGDGDAAVRARLSGPYDVACAPGGIVIADTNNERIRLVDTAGQMSTLAGTAPGGLGGPSAFGDRSELGMGPGFGAARANQNDIGRPSAVEVGPRGPVVADPYRHRVLEITWDGVVRVLVGGGRSAASVDGTPAVTAGIDGPRGLAIGADGTVYIAETGRHRIRTVTPAGMLNTLTG